MGILLACLVGMAVVVGLFCLFIIFRWVKWCGFVLFVIVMPISLGALYYTVISDSTKSPASYQTEVYISSIDKNQIIRFNQFEQLDDSVIIPNYYIGDWQTGFGYKFIDEPVTIKVEDGQEFKYRIIREPEYKQTIVEDCGD